jgi:hypothetical protein
MAADIGVDVADLMDAGYGAAATDGSDREEQDEGAGTADRSGSRGKKAKRRGGGGGGEDRAAAEVLAGDVDVDADELAERHWKAKRERAELGALRKELEQLLSQSLLPAGTSRR